MPPRSDEGRGGLPAHPRGPADDDDVLRNLRGEAAAAAARSRGVSILEMNCERAAREEPGAGEHSWKCPVDLPMSR